MEISSTKGRVWWGVLGGICALGAKYLGQDHHDVRVWLQAADYVKCENLAYGYLVVGLVLCGIGAIVAAASGEAHPMKLLAIAVAGPAIITTYAGGGKSDDVPVPPIAVSFVSPAFAEDIGPVPLEKSGPSVVDGIKLFFGYGREDRVYRVVAGSYANKTDAAIAAAKVKQALPTLNVYVGPSAPGNEHFPVLVGSFEHLETASALRDDVITKAGIPDAFLSPQKTR